MNYKKTNKNNNKTNHKYQIYQQMQSFHQSMQVFRKRIGDRQYLWYLLRKSDVKPTNTYLKYLLCYRVLWRKILYIKRSVQKDKYVEIIHNKNQIRCLQNKNCFIFLKQKVKTFEKKGLVSFLVEY